MLVKQAEMLATELHRNQKDKANKPYVEHLKAVVGNLVNPTDEMLIVAWLHDSVEDTSITLEELKDLFGETISAAIDAITKRKDESYDIYLQRVKVNELAKIVKVADLTHNMDLSRLPFITEKDLSRYKKYESAKHYLS